LASSRKPPVGWFPEPGIVAASHPLPPGLGKPDTVIDHPRSPVLGKPYQRLVWWRKDSAAARYSMLRFSVTLQGVDDQTQRFGPPSWPGLADEGEPKVTEPSQATPPAAPLPPLTYGLQPRED
jgi:hypothetical protein